MRKTAVVLAVAAVAAGVGAVPNDARRAEAEKEARAVLEKLTPDEKVQMLMMDNPEIKRVGIPRFHWWSEALHGYARSGLATVFPQAIGAAATFDDELELRMADAISTEARAKVNLYRAQGERGGNHCLSLWSPNVNMDRDPRWGRGQETFGEDPYLTSRMGVAFVKGIQGDDPKYLKAVACAKHYAVHSGPEKKRHEFNVNLDDRDLYEYYLPAFKALVKEAKVESVMGAYSAVNGVPCCANKRLLVDILRGEWGFRGTVVSDVGAVDDIWKNHKYRKNAVEGDLAAIEGGLDLCSEATYHHMRGPVKEGKIDPAIFDKPLMHILTTRALLGDLDPKAKTPWDNLGEKDVNNAKHKAIALECAEKSIVLLKNDGVLPLDASKLKRLDVTGRSREEHILMGNYNGEPADAVTILKGFLRELGSGVFIDTTSDSDPLVRVIGLCPIDEGEDRDRKDIGMWPQQLKDLRRDRQRRPERKIIAVVPGGSAMDLREVCELCDAVLVCWYPGELGGTAVARTVVGKNNPSGRLPVTFYRNPGKMPDFEDYTLPGRTYLYTDQNVLYPFGYGLSYTTFAYTGIKADTRNLPKTAAAVEIDPDFSIRRDEAGQSQSDAGEKRPKQAAAPVAPSAPMLTVSIDVENTGAVAGDEVVQLYVRSPEDSGDRRIHHLEGFKRVALKPGEKKRVSFALTAGQLAQFGKDGRQTLAKGVYRIFVGGGQPGYCDNTKCIMVEL